MMTLTNYSDTTPVITSEYDALDLHGERTRLEFNDPRNYNPYSLLRSCASGSGSHASSLNAPAFEKIEISVRFLHASILTSAR